MSHRYLCHLDTIDTYCFDLFMQKYRFVVLLSFRWALFTVLPSILYVQLIGCCIPGKEFIGIAFKAPVSMHINLNVRNLQYTYWIEELTGGSDDFAREIFISASDYSVYLKFLSHKLLCFPFYMLITDYNPVFLSLRTMLILSCVFIYLHSWIAALVILKLWTEKSLLCIIYASAGFLQ